MVTSPVTNKKQRSQGIKPTEKWCPMARVVVHIGPPPPGFESASGVLAANRFPAGDGLSDYWRDARCLGTACAVFVGDDSTGHCGLMRGLT